MPQITIVTTGEKWIGYGFRSFSSVIEEMLTNAKREVVITIYMISDMKVVENVKKALEKGITIEIFINNSELVTNGNDAINAIFNLKKSYQYLRIYNIYNDVLHAKILVGDNKHVLIGSANLTFSGMVKNYELGFLINDYRIAKNILTLLRRLVK